MKQITFIKMALFLLMFVFQFPVTTFANSAPIYQPEPNGTLIPLEDSPIIVQEERLQFILNNTLRPAEVVVQYTFHNPTDQEIESLLAFPFTPFSHEATARIFVGNQEIPNDQTVVYVNKSDYADMLTEFKSDTFTFIDPVTKEIDEDWDHYDIIEESKVVTFTVPFKANDETVVRLEYKQAYGTDKYSYINRVHAYQYLLQPASKWKEFHNLHITMVVPKDNYFASNLPIEKYSGSLTELPLLPSAIANDLGAWDIYKGYFETLPKENLAFSTMSSENIHFGEVEQDFYNMFDHAILLGLATFFLLILVFLFNRVKRGWIRWFVGSITAFFVTLSLTFLSYGFLTKLFPFVGHGIFEGEYGFFFTFFFLICYTLIGYFSFMALARMISRYKSTRF
jgi:hypothetical protein